MKGLNAHSSREVWMDASTCRPYSSYQRNSPRRSKNGLISNFPQDDLHFNQIVDDIQQASTCAESSAVTSSDSIVRLAFIFGGKVTKGQPNDLLSGMQKQLYTKLKASTFAFKPDDDAPSRWWGEAYYSTKSMHQRQLWMHLYSVDKLYAADCPEQLSNRRHVEGTVTDEKGEPLSDANVGIGFVTPWDAVTTDSQGHFNLWMPFHDAAICVNRMGYMPHVVHPSDTALTICMKDATKLRELKVPNQRVEE
ncbi:MAG: carboxypeptidase-like regulatory domain-containing protein [Prevotella sp.]|nr:carboxypeptidase-like regulatory domain-containing protein [Prevotella sp.]